jgi:hypothetical protein
MSAPVLDIRGLTIALPASGERAYAVANATVAVAPGEMVCLWFGQVGTRRPQWPVAAAARDRRVILLDGENARRE